MEEAAAAEPCKSPSLLSSLRQFRYTGSQPPKLPGTSEAAKPAAESQTQAPLKLNTEIFKRLREESGSDDILPPVKRERFAYFNGKPERANEALEFLKKLYPLIDLLDIQDSLVQSNYNVDVAIKTLNKVIVEKINMKPKPVATVSTMTSTGVATDKVWKRNGPPQFKFAKVSSTSAGTSTSVGTSAGTSTTKPAKPVVAKKESDDFVYNFNPRAVKVTVLHFMSSASLAELVTVSNVSRKKAELIIKARPFTDWLSFCKKIKPIGIDVDCVYDSVKEVLKMRSEVAELMKTCQQLSQRLDLRVQEISAESKKSVQASSLSPWLKLADYQLVGVSWLRLLFMQNVNGILADEMGLGKTIQVIAFLAYLKEQEYKDGVHLIVVPASTLENWANEFKRWCPSLRVKRYYGSQEERKEIRSWWRDEKNKSEVEEVDILLTTYNLVSSTKDDKGFFRKLDIQYIVYDEGHMLKNMATLRYTTLMRIRGRHRLLLTGTPLQNNIIELMSLLMFVMPEIFSDREYVLKWLFKPNKAANDDEQCCFEKEKISQATKIMEPFVLRRLKKDVLGDLPLKTEIIEYCEMSVKQTKYYNDLLREFQKIERDEIEEIPDPLGCGSGTPPRLYTRAGEEPDEEDLDAKDQAATNNEADGLTGSMAKMMLLRRAANHPALLRIHFTDKIIEAMAKKLKRDRTFRENNLENIEIMLHNMSDHQLNNLCDLHTSISRHGITNDYLLDSGKINKLDDILPELKEGGHRVLIFSQFRQAIDILEDYMRIRQHTWLKLDGTTPVAERQTMIDKFNSDDSIFAFLLTTKAGGCGINLAGADTVIIFDIDLNPYNDKQAEDRCHRVGQTRPVTVIRFISKDSIEEAMLKIATGKLSLERQITQGVDSKENNKKLLRWIKELTVEQAGEVFYWQSNRRKAFLV